MWIYLKYIPLSRSFFSLLATFLLLFLLREKTANITMDKILKYEMAKPLDGSDITDATQAIKEVINLRRLLTEFSNINYNIEGTELNEIGKSCKHQDSIIYTAVVIGNIVLPGGAGGLEIVEAILWYLDDVSLVKFFNTSAIKQLSVAYNSERLVNICNVTTKLYTVVHVAAVQYEKAMLNVEKINKKDLWHPFFTHAPTLVIKVFTAVHILFEGKDEGWKGCKIMLGKGDFLKRIFDYDRTQKIPKKRLRKLRKYLYYFTFEDVKKKCKSVNLNAAIICEWFEAIMFWQDVETILNEEYLTLRSRNHSKIL